MAKVGIFSTPPEKHFLYGGDTEILIRYINKEELSKIIQKSDSVAKKLGANNSSLYDIFLGRAAVLGWRKQDDHEHPGLEMPDGSAIPFTDENRDKMMKRCREFAAFVLRYATDSQGFLENGVILDDLNDEDLKGLETLIKEDDEKKQ